MLSWAGEKMPWLIVHIALPGTILAGAAIGSLIERGIVLANERRIGLLDLGIFAGLITAVIGWFFLAARLTYGSFNGTCVNGDSDCRRVTDSDLSKWWVFAIPPCHLPRPARDLRIAARLATVGAGRRLRGRARPGILEVRVGWRSAMTIQTCRPR